MVPRISVVLPTYKREKELLNVLEMLKSQTISDFEVIIADQSETHSDGFKKNLEKYLMDKRFRYFCFSPPHITKAKNKAISLAKSGIVLTLDDDVSFGSQLIGAHLNQYLDQKVVAVGGKVINQKDGSEITGTRQNKMNLLGNFSWVKVDKATEVSLVGGGCDLSFRKEVWERSGGYDENFYGNCAYEDIDFCFSLKRFGKIIYEPKAEVLHLKATGGSRSFGDKLSWFEQLFANYLYFSLKNYGSFWPIHILKHWRAVGRCVVLGGFRGIKVAINGYARGYQIYQQYFIRN
ncbi:hypothetical protein COT51_01810 [candidate division WWE3 bacterium CG08_land_8_20_14_0_20_41_15]|uniref:Glycosyltransferase 2-like domain-containing protein n=1 Tax=candidate division WWE3 bacterium CG08_land_8_20_14_0_20_41_15 TaxID=1975086 RepID=A0A2H0X9W2_UNCKA|nr:MAG: hypothetical protein COT51_01810 [candidate division WWE3 bacterium CG08_land_8_20_14_0_20_41_15]